jgi:hypothetical protein
LEHNNCGPLNISERPKPYGNDAKSRGEAGELLLHVACRQEFSTRQLVARLKYHSSKAVGSVSPTVCKRWPAIKTIIASGQVRLIGSDLTAGSRFFLKPYRVRTMISEVRSLIGP